MRECLAPEASLALLELPSATTERWREQLAEPHRHYHDERHIAAMLRAIPEGRATRELIAAIWLHDIVYDPRAADNEERSADQARRDLAGNGIDSDAVVALILATKHHRAETEDQRLLNDLDLGILGAPPSEYARYAEAIGREYAHVPAEAYRAGRARVLRGLLDVPAIFHGREFKPLEAQARTNLAAEIAELEGR